MRPSGQCEAFLRVPQDGSFATSADYPEIKQTLYMLRNHLRRSYAVLKHFSCEQSVTEKQMNKCMAEIYGSGRIRTSDLVHQKPIRLPLS